MLLQLHPALESANLRRGRANRCPQTHGRGVTLVELLVTVAVAAVVLTLGVPSMRDFVQSNRMTTLTNDMATAIHLARTEAIRRGVPVEVCARSNSSDDSLLCGDSWNNGWVVRADPGGTNEDVIWSRGVVGGAATVTTSTVAGSGNASTTSGNSNSNSNSNGNGNGSSNNSNSSTTPALRFTPRGHLVNTPAQSTATVEFRFCSPNPNVNDSEITIGASGRAQVVKVDHSTC